jgi:hypothetical protein
VTFVAAPAFAKVQNSAQTQLGVANVGSPDGRSTKMDLGLRFESVWFRESPRDFGIGPYVEARTAWFDHADYGGGLVALVPVDLTFPLWFGGGGFARRGGGTWSPGFDGFLAWGGRSFNHHSSYAMVFGLLLDARVHGGDEKGTDVVLAATLDLEGLALPFLYAVSAVRH